MNFENMSDEDLYKHALKINKNANDLQLLSNKLPIIFLIIAIISIILVSYYCPFSEELNCDSSYTCKINQSFIFNIKKTKKFKINSNSFIEIKQKAPFGAYSQRGHSQTYYVYPSLNVDNKNITPFIGYIDSYKDYKLQEQLNKDYDYIIRNFNAYINKSSDYFHIESISNGYFVIIWLFVLIIGIPLWYFMESKKS